jgi:hypothetical protein
MNNTTMKWMLIGALGIFAGASSTQAQSMLGGAKTQQSKIGGAAKPAPVIGGATIHSPPPPALPKPVPVVGTIKPGPPGTGTPGTTANAAALGTPGTTRPNPSITAPNKGGPVVTPNLKCASGACTSRAAKP